MKGQMNYYKNIEKEENILNLGHMKKTNNKMALMLSYACRTILGKGHIRDRTWNQEMWKRFGR